MIQKTQTDAAFQLALKQLAEAFDEMEKHPFGRIELTILREKGRFFAVETTTTKRQHVKQLTKRDRPATIAEITGN